MRYLRATLEDWYYDYWPRANFWWAAFYAIWFGGTLLAMRVDNHPESLILYAGALGFVFALVWLRATNAYEKVRTKASVYDLDLMDDIARIHRREQHEQYLSNLRHSQRMMATMLVWAQNHANQYPEDFNTIEDLKHDLKALNREYFNASMSQYDRY